MLSSLEPPPPRNPFDPLPLVERAKRSLRFAYRATGRGCIEFYNSSNLTFASSIAYYSLLSFFPFLVLVASLVARLGGGAPKEALKALIERSLPSHFDFLEKAVEQLDQTSLQFGVLGTILTLWASLGFFRGVRWAVNHAWVV
jgi:uncharacterized BrkB/YihY/UPF0761 family membrane protein